MRRGLALGLIFLSGCGGCSSSTKIGVTLESGTCALFDAYAADAAMTKVRITADGLGQYDDVVVDLEPSVKSAEIEGAFDEGAVAVRVEGFNLDGNVVAYGVASVDISEGDQNIAIKLRRNVAISTHADLDGQDDPAGKIYAIDVVRRTLLGTLRLPGTSPRAQRISSRGGDSMLIVYEDAGAGFVAEMSADTCEMRTIPLTGRQDLALAIPGRPIGVVGGGGSLSFVDFDQGRVLADLDIGGSVRDGAISADGSRAVFVVDVAPGVVLVNLTENCTSSFMPSSCRVALDVVSEPGGVAISPDGLFAFVASSNNGAVARIDLSRNTSVPLKTFPTGVFQIAYSAEIPALLGVQRSPDGTGRVHTYVLANDKSTFAEDGIQTYLNPVDISADPTGRRAIVVSIGTSTASSGLTVIESAFNAVAGSLRAPIGSSRLYPPDPDDTYGDGDFLLHQRYRPTSVAVINGR
jgi:hypothetical protein